MKMTSKMKMNRKRILENTNCYGPKIEDTIKKYSLKKNYLKNEDKNKKRTRLRSKVFSLEKTNLRLCCGKGLDFFSPFFLGWG